MTEGLKSIAALRRGMDVLLAIERMSSLPLGELHRRTGIPKASLLRILKTLQESGWVQRDAISGHYSRLTIETTDETIPWHRQLTAAAAKPRAALQGRLPWPTDLAVRDGQAMLVLDTHRPLVGLSVNYRLIGFRPHMLASALGRCYLAFCPPAECEDIIAALARSPSEIDLPSRDRASLRQMLAQIRQRGYATRDARHQGADTRMAQRFSAIAVPILQGDRVLACLACTWLSALSTEQAFVHAHLAQLQGTASTIAAKVMPLPSA